MFNNIKKRKKHKKVHLKLYILSFLLAVVLICSYIVSLFNQRFLPAIIEIASIDAQTNINKLINDSLAGTTRDLGLNSSDFYVKSIDNSGKINSLSANTILINDVCSRLAAEISEKLSDTGAQTVSIPIGALLDIDILANTGPHYSVKVLPKGNATVDYETEFISAGINQINYQIWLIIETKVHIVNPMQNREIVITRKVSLVNTVINGEVPPAYINTIPRG